MTKENTFGILSIMAFALKEYEGSGLIFQVCALTRHCADDEDISAEVKTNSCSALFKERF